MSAYKARQVLDLDPGQGRRPGRRDPAHHADREAAAVVGKVLASAVANAVHNDGLDPEDLYVSACYADEGTTLKRWRPRARGRATRIRKRTCHITVIVSRLPDDRLDRRRAAAGGRRRPSAPAGWPSSRRRRADGRGRAHRRRPPRPTEADDGRRRRRTEVVDGRGRAEAEAIDGRRASVDRRRGRGRCRGRGRRATSTTDADEADDDEADEADARTTTATTQRRRASRWARRSTPTGSASA